MIRTKNASKITYLRWKLVEKISYVAFKKLNEDSKIPNVWEKIYGLCDRISGNMLVRYGLVREQVHIKGNRYYDRDVAYDLLDTDRKCIKKIYKEYPEYTMD